MDFQVLREWSVPQAWEKKRAPGLALRGPAPLELAVPELMVLEQRVTLQNPHLPFLRYQQAFVNRLKVFRHQCSQFSLLPELIRPALKLPVSKPALVVILETQHLSQYSLAYSSLFERPVSYIWAGHLSGVLDTW
jgi:hypothetical protein